MSRRLRVAMEQVGKNAGLSAQSLDYFVERLKTAGITTQEAMLGVTKFMVAGLDLTKLQELATRARDIAVVANVNTSEAFSRLIQGIISGETEMLRRLMVNVGHIDDLLKRHAQTLGIEKDQIDAVTRANIVLNAVLEASARFAGAAAAADATVGKQLASLSRYAGTDLGIALLDICGTFMGLSKAEIRIPFTLGRQFKHKVNQLAQVSPWGVN